MFKLDNNFLTSLGLGGLPVDEKNKLLQMIYERLEMNVGMRLAEKMTDQQLDEFEAFIDQNDEAGALKWLETNFPNYKDVVAEELEKLKVEVTAAAPQILASHNGAQPQPAIMTEPVMPGVPQPTIQQPQQPAYASQPQAPQQSQTFAPPTPSQPMFNPQQQPSENLAPQPPIQPYAPDVPAPAPVMSTPQTPTFDPTYAYQSAPAPQPTPQVQRPATIPTGGFMPQPSFNPTPQPAPSFQPAPPSQPQPFNQPQTAGQFTPPPADGFTPPLTPSANDFTPGQQ